MVRFICRIGLTEVIAAALGLFLGTVNLSAEITISYMRRQNPALPGQVAPGDFTAFGSTTTVAGSYQWFHNGIAIPGSAGANLSLFNVTASDSGNYWLSITANGATQTSNTLTVNVLDFPASPLDPTFMCANPPDLRTPPIASFAADGSMILNTAPNELPSQVRIRPDGSLDQSFRVPSSAQTVLAGLPNGQLIVAYPPYRLNADTTAAPMAVPAGLSGQLSAAAVQSDGKILLAQDRTLVRFNPDGSIDPSFAYTSSLSSQHSIARLKFDAGGRIYLNATERNPVNGNSPQTWPVIIRLSGTGSEDPTFAHQLSRNPGSPGAIDVDPLNDGRILRTGSDADGRYGEMILDNGTVQTDWTSNLINSSIVSLAVDPAGRIFLVNAEGKITRNIVTSTGLIEDRTFYQGYGAAAMIQLTPSGKLMVSGSFIYWDGVHTPGLARLSSTDTDAIIPASPSISPVNGVVPNFGETLTLISAVNGTGPFTYQWLALDGQPLPADTTSAQLVIPNYSTQYFGRYQLRVTGPAGVVLSPVSVLSFNPGDPPYLANLSGRAFVGTGDDTAIAGVAVKFSSGSDGVPTLLRGGGPALGSYGVMGFLPDPVLSLYGTAGEVIATNDNWGGDPDIQDAAVTAGAFPFLPGSTDAALLHSLLTTNATLQLVDHDRASGTGLLEIYRLPGGNTAGEIVNLSLRARTAPGEKVATAGFVIVDPRGYGRIARVVLRVVGPTLSNYGVTNALADPILTLYRADGTIVASNDNWSVGFGAPELIDAMTHVGAFNLPSNSKDSGLLIDLPAGVYSVQATSAAGTPNTGVVLIEVYVVR